MGDKTYRGYAFIMTPDKEVDKKGGRGLTITFPDVPEAQVWVKSIKRAYAEAEDTLKASLGFYFEDKRPLNEPTATIHDGLAGLVLLDRATRKKVLDHQSSLGVGVIYPDYISTEKESESD